MKTDPIFQEKYQELQLQMAMHLLSQKELEEAEEEISKLNGQPEFAPTPQEEEWIMGIIDQELKQQKRKERWKKASRILQKVSVLLLILLIGLCTTVITVEAVRIPFIDWLMSFQEDSMSVHFHRIVVHFLTPRLAANWCGAKNCAARIRRQRHVFGSLNYNRFLCECAYLRLAPGALGTMRAGFWTESRSLALRGSC